MEKLFDGFRPVTPQQWKDQIIKDLKGTDPDSLLWNTAAGITVKPFYTREDQPAPTPPVFTHHHWEIGEAVVVRDEKTANTQALQALSGGASALSFCVNGDQHLDTLLQGIFIEHITIEFILNNHVDAFLGQLQEIITVRGLQHTPLRLSVNYDVLAHLAEHGNWLSSPEQDLGDVLKVANSPFNAHNVLVDGTLYQNTGATAVTELALLLCHYHEYLALFSEKGFDLKQLEKNGIQLNLAVGSDFFMEIAKLRALQHLVALVHREYRINAPVFISATTSQLTQTGKDAYTNLLRSTTQAMSAVIGGSQVVYVQPYNQRQEGPTAFSERMARNQQLILKDESYLDKVADAGAGSYYIDTLTAQLAEQAWKQFQEWEAAGGFIAALQSGAIQKKVTEEATALSAKAQSGELVIIGANKYMNPKEDVVKPKSNGSQTAAKTLFAPLKALNLPALFEQQPATAKP